MLSLRQDSATDHKRERKLSKPNIIAYPENTELVGIHWLTQNSPKQSKAVQENHLSTNRYKTVQEKYFKVPINQALHETK